MRQLLSVDGRSTLLTSLVTTAILIGLKTLGLFEPIELLLFDRLSGFRADEPNDPRLLIVGMTEDDIQQYGWPLSDDMLTTILQRLQRHRPSVIGLDLYRSSLQGGEPLTPATFALRQQLAADNLITIMAVGSDPNHGDVPPPPTVPDHRIGFNDLVIDPDGIVRRSLLFAKTPERHYYSFALRTALAYWQASPLALRGSECEENDHCSDRLFHYDNDSLYIGSHEIPALKSSSGGYQTLDSRGYQIVLRYRSRHFPAQHVSISQVLSDTLVPEMIANKIVLVGTTAPSLKDQFYTPYSVGQRTEFSMSGVVMHAQMISQLLDTVEQRQVLYRFMPQWGESLWLLIWSAIAGMITWRLRHPISSFGIGSLSLLVLLGSAAGALSVYIWVPIAEPMFGIILTGGLVTTQKLLYRSTHDSLTGLPNRELFCHCVQHALNKRSKHHPSLPIIIAFLDLDRFKLINQSWGHGMGDQVLMSMVHRLTPFLPDAAQLARVGGDEFAILFEQASQEQVEQCLSQIQKAIADPLFLKGQQLSLTASVGIAIAATSDHPQANNNADDLLRDAHTAMYWAKSLGQSSYQVFATGMHSQAVDRLHLTSDLSAAINNREFLLYYQPIIDLSTKHIVGFEALVRWQQPDRGFVLPSLFIPMAEETELIVPLGKWVLSEACHQLKQWQQQFPHLPLKMSINLSRRQLSHPGLVSYIKDCLQTNGLKGDAITLEITESLMIQDEQTAMTLMLQLKEMGILLSIDDFGTGYSSLSQLHSFPMDILKIDKSFITRLEQSDKDQAIIQTIITLGQQLGMGVVAEGIESSTQLAYLQNSNCQYGQGYFFAAPLSADQATQWLAQHFGDQDSDRP